MSECRIGIIGDKGHFGAFLENILFAELGLTRQQGVDLGSTRVERDHLLSHATDVILCTPLDGYEAATASVMKDLFAKATPTTLWLIPSIQAPAVAAAKALLADATTARVAVVAIHPLFGPHSFAQCKPGRSQRLQLVLTYLSDPFLLQEKITFLVETLGARRAVELIARYGPEEHDMAVAKSQGLAFCVGLTCLARPDLARELQERWPWLHALFISDQTLMAAFARLNPYFKEVAETFATCWRGTPGLSVHDVFEAFVLADHILNGGASAPLVTHAYTQLRRLGLAKESGGDSRS